MIPIEKGSYLAEIDREILDLLKENPGGLSVYALQEKLREYKRSNYFEDDRDYRATISTRLRYLRALGEKTHLFRIISNRDEDDDPEEKKKLFFYVSKMSKADIQLMLRSYRAIRGRPREKKRKTEDAPNEYSDGSREFFSGLTKKQFIDSFDDEYPPAPENKMMPQNMNTILSAITDKIALELEYGDYNFDMKLCPRINKTGKPNKYIIYPIKMVVSLGRYYLYCKHKYFTNLSCLRVDRIISCKRLEGEKCPWGATPTEFILNGAREPHFAQRLYMYTGEPLGIKFITDDRHINDVIDWFGSEAKLTRNEDNTITAAVKADRKAMLCWALQYCRFVTVTEPPELVDDIRKALEDASKKYN